MKDKENEQALSEQITAEKILFPRKFNRARNAYSLFSSDQKNSFKLKWRTKKENRKSNQAICPTQDFKCKIQRFAFWPSKLIEEAGEDRNVRSPKIFQHKNHITFICF